MDYDCSQCGKPFQPNYDPKHEQFGMTTQIDRSDQLVSTPHTSLENISLTKATFSIVSLIFVCPPHSDAPNTLWVQITIVVMPRT